MVRSSRAAAHLVRTGLASGLVLCVVPIVCLELVLELVLRHPQAMPDLFRPANHVSHLKNYYLEFDRSIVQFRGDCAMYDDKLIYRLRPGACTVRNRESVVEYAVNRAGVRDSDEKLLDHSVLLVGDSIAMGWGVAREAMLSQRLGALTNRKVLNAAISSYETAREMALLRELVRPSTEYVIIAYCNNDYFENWSFIRHGSLPWMDRQAYQSIAHNHESKVPYYPLKHTRHLVESVVKSASARPAPAFRERPGFAAMAFLAILDSHRDALRGRHVIVFEANSWNDNSSLFATALRQAAARSPLLSELSSLHVVDPSTVLTDDDYFLLDDHMTAGGHDKVARQLAAIVQGDDRWRVRAAPDVALSDFGSAPGGQVEQVEQKAALTIISGWAARRNSGEPPATVALLRDSMKIAEAEPVFPRGDVAAALGKPSASLSGFALAVATDRLAEAKDLRVVGVWSDGQIGLLNREGTALEPGKQSEKR